MATAEFSKVAGILSAALSQHHLLGFEIALTGTPLPQRSSKDSGEDRYEQKFPAVVMHRLSCPRACGIFPDWIEPVSPALAGRFFTSEPPGKSKRGSPFRELCLESTLPRVRVFPHLQLGKGTSLGLRGKLALCSLQLRTQESGV